MINQHKQMAMGKKIPQEQQKTQPVDGYACGGKVKKEKKKK
jgi:hypothetical protein